MGGGSAHVVRVVYDINVYLDVAEQLGPDPWDRLEAAPPPCRGSSVQQSVSIAGEGVFAHPVPLELWTSQHIATLTITILTSSRKQFRWPQADAKRFVEDIGKIVAATGGEELDVFTPEGPPSLGREDGLVLATAVDARAPFLVTSDGDFASKLGPVWNGIKILAPNQWVAFVDKYRRA